MIKYFGHFEFALRILLTCTLIAVLSACATNGVIDGRLGGHTVRLHYHHSFWHPNGAITGAMPNGERFAGKFVIGTTSTTGIGVGTGSGDVGVFTGRGNTSHAAAVLTGDRGGSMHCNFTLAKPDDGLEGGGVGYCKLSTGQEINVTF